MSVESILQYAFDKFDACNYDEAVKAFIAAFVASDDPGQKSDIFEVINESFIRPNVDEFKKTFDENISKLIDKGMLSEDNVPDYDRNTLFMIPVSNTVYYIWDKENTKFYSGQHYDFSARPAGDVYRSIDSIVIDGFSDLKMILEATYKELYSHEYIVLEDEKIRNEFFSFFMIPGIADQLDEATKIFVDRQDLLEFLYETGNYIPRTIKCASNYDYAGYLSELHQKRISGPKRTQPFVAITMPTFNRGKKALENVKRLQSLMYDEEVAFIICNNSSTQETEYYDEIEELSHTDSRIKYYIKPSACFMDSAENVFQFNESKFTLFCSDEDFIITENFAYALEELNRYPDYGVRCFGVFGEEYYLENERIEKVAGTHGLQAGFGCNYMTGVCFKPSEIAQNDLLNRFSVYRDGNEYYWHYTHCVYTAFLAHKNGLCVPNIPLFYDSVGNDLDKDEADEEVREHIRVEGRIKETDGQLQILMNMDATKDEIMGCVIVMMLNLYKRIRVAYGHYYKGMTKLHSWDEVCEIIDNYFLDILRKLSGDPLYTDEDIAILYANYDQLKKNEHNDRPYDYREVIDRE